MTSAPQGLRWPEHICIDALTLTRGTMTLEVRGDGLYGGMRTVMRMQHSRATGSI